MRRVSARFEPRLLFVLAPSGQSCRMTAYCSKSSGGAGSTPGAKRVRRASRRNGPSTRRRSCRWWARAEHSRRRGAMLGPQVCSKQSLLQNRVSSKPKPRAGCVPFMSACHWQVSSSVRESIVCLGRAGSQNLPCVHALWTQVRCIQRAGAVRRVGGVLPLRIKQ